jgi:hypothetical protein
MSQDLIHFTSISELPHSPLPDEAYWSLHHNTLHYVHFVKYDDAVSFYDAVSDTIRRRGGNRGIFTEEGVDTVAYFGGNHGSRV